MIFDRSGASALNMLPNQGIFAVIVLQFRLDAIHMRILHVRLLRNGSLTFHRIDERELEILADGIAPMRAQKPFESPH